MGYDLHRDAEDEALAYFRYNYWGWPSVLTLGARYGWEPAGTKLKDLSEEEIRENNIPEDQVKRYREVVVDWEGGYNSNDGQTVTASDASALATAIENSLDDIPDHQIPTPGQEADGTTKLDNPLWQKHREDLRSGSLPSLLVTFSGKDSKQRLRKFIKFLRGGDFQIH